MQCTEVHQTPGSAGRGLIGPSMQGVKAELPALERAITERHFRQASPVRSRHHRQRSLSEGRAVDMVTPEQYAALPLSIQKKYFSSVERLRITQATAAQKRKKQRRKQTWLSSTSSADLTFRPRSARELRLSPFPKDATQHIAEQQPRLSTTRERAACFLNLPDKVQRQHFSKEEHTLLKAECEKLRREGEVNAGGRLVPSRPSLVHGHSAPESRLVESARTTADQVNDHCETDELSQRSRSTVETEMGIFQLYFKKHREPAPSTNVPPPTRAPPSAPLPTTSTAASLQRKSFHRTLALTPLALPPPTLAPLPTLPSPSPIRTTARLSRPYTDPVLLPAEPYPEPTYYQDPRARKQLRDYLTSQHRFDETIEFGFPSPESAPPSSAGTDEYFPIQRASPAFSTDGDDASLQSDGPSTPVAVPSRHARKPTMSASFDSGIVLPLQLNASGHGERSRSSSNISGREMTLHLTLTRPETRTSEEAHYGWQRTPPRGVMVAESDPLALAPLSVNEDSTGANGAFAGRKGGHSKGLGRVWKSMRRH